MSGPHDALCINSFYPETELNVTEIQEYECINNDCEVTTFAEHLMAFLILIVV